MINYEYAEHTSGSSSLQKSLISVAKGTLFGYIFLVAAFLVLAAVYTYTAFPAGLISPFTQGIAALSMIFCGVLSARNIQGFGWLHGAAAGLVYSLIRITVSSLVLGAFSLDKNTLSMLVLGLVLGAAGGIIGINFKK